MELSVDCLVDHAKIADDPGQWSSVQAERDSEEAVLVDDIR